MTAIAPLNRYRSALVERVNDGHRPPKGPAIQCGKKCGVVVAARMLGRSAAASTTSSAQARIVIRAPTPSATSRRPGRTSDPDRDLSRLLMSAGPRRAPMTRSPLWAYPVTDAGPRRDQPGCPLRWTLLLQRLRWSLRLRP